MPLKEIYSDVPGNDEAEGVTFLQYSTVSKYLHFIFYKKKKKTPHEERWLVDVVFAV